MTLEPWELPPGCREPLSAPVEDVWGDGETLARAVKVSRERWVLFVRSRGHNRVVGKYFHGPVVWRVPPRGRNSHKLWRIVSHAGLGAQGLMLGRLFVLPQEQGEPRVVAMHETYGGDWLRPDLSCRGGSIQSGRINGEPDLHAALLRELADPDSFISDSWLVTGMSDEELDRHQERRRRRNLRADKLPWRVADAAKRLLAKMRGDPST